MDSFISRDTSPELTSSVLPLRRFNQSQGTIDHRVGFFKSDFGEMKLMTNLNKCLPSTTHLLVIDEAMLELGVVKAPSARPLEDRGGGPLAIVEAIFVLMCLNPQAFGIATSVATQ